MHAARSAHARGRLASVRARRTPRRAAHTTHLAYLLSDSNKPAQTKFQDWTLKTSRTDLKKGKKTLFLFFHRCRDQKRHGPFGMAAAPRRYRRAAAVQAAAEGGGSNKHDDAAALEGWRPPSWARGPGADVGDGLADKIRDLAATHQGRRP